MVQIGTRCWAEWGVVIELYRNYRNGWDIVGGLLQSCIGTIEMGGTSWGCCYRAV
jgi:hypothetical protein